MPDLKPTRRVTVLAVDRLTTNMRRLVLGGPELDGFTLDPASWGPYVKLLIPRANASPAVRTYSVRAFDAERRELTVDVVIHAPRGIASAWAEDVRPGAELGLHGPGAVPVARDAGFIVLAGDHSALPAIAYTLECLPPHARGSAAIALDDAADRQDLRGPEGVEIRWLDGDAAPPLDAVVQAAPWPTGAFVVWAGAEAALARSLRAFAQSKSIAQERRPILNYWKRGAPEGGFAYVE